MTAKPPAPHIRHFVAGIGRRGIRIYIPESEFAPPASAKHGLLIRDKTVFIIREQPPRDIDAFAAAFGGRVVSSWSAVWRSEAKWWKPLTWWRGYFEMVDGHSLWEKGEAPEEVEAIADIHPIADRPMTDEEMNFWEDHIGQR